ncbi:peptidase S8 [Brevundimonas sp. Root1423]|nr:peptidase S8 [Brevundimonas sp. Root1423]KRA29320.1 peptidase S8 [Brevundimonas sp. Root608]
MNAIAAWDTGATGLGINVGVIDSGIDFNQADLVGRISPLSTDVVPGRNTPTGTVGTNGAPAHGTMVSGVVASNFNGFGTIGVAYEATVISIRSDISDCTDPDDTVCFRSSDLARAIDYAIANNVRIINMSLGGDTPLGGVFEAAMQRAVNAGLVFAIAAGNESGPSPEWPGRYATDPRFLGNIIVVGAHDSANQIAGFSNRAGVSANEFISAPGVDVITNCDGTVCYRINGTSFSAPAVAGALALLLDAFPNLTGRQALQILLTSARDTGDAGVDPIYGRGLLDLARAFQPIGSTAVAMRSGETVSVTSQRYAYTGGAFGDAIRSAPGLQTVGHDDFDRLFRVNLAASYGLAPRGVANMLPQAPREQARLTTAGPMGSTLSLTTSAAVEDSAYDLVTSTGVITPWLDERRREDVMMEFSAGPGLVAVWQGRNGARSPFSLGAADNFASLAQVDRAWLGAVRLGAVTLTADTGVGDRAMPFQTREEDVSRYARFVADWQASPTSRLRFAVGGLDEKMGPLGSYAPLDSGFALPSNTTFGSVSGQFALRSNLFLNAEMGWARTDLEGRFLSLSETALSSTWALGLTTFCHRLGFACESLTWSIAQPLRTESGVFSAYLADAPASYFDTPAFSERTFSATPSGRQIDMSLGSVHRLGDGSALNLRALVTRDDQNVRSSPTTWTLMGSWGKTF